MNLQFALLFFLSFSLFYFEAKSVNSRLNQYRYLKNIPDCDAKAMKKADQTMQKLVTTGRAGRKFPESMKQLPGYCSESEKLIDDLNKFIIKCYEPEIRDIAKIMVFSVKNMIKQFCRRRSKKLTKLLPIARCINTEVRNNTCMRRFIDRASKFQYLADNKRKIPYTCCEYSAALNCVENQLETIPCARKNLPVALDFIKGLFGNMANFACGEYTESTTRCEELGPPPKVNIRNAKKYSTFMFVLIDLMESMDGFSLL